MTELIFGGFAAVSERWEAQNYPLYPFCGLPERNFDFGTIFGQIDGQSVHQMGLQGIVTCDPPKYFSEKSRCDRDMTN